MSLSQMAERDLQYIMEEDVSGPRWALSVTDPSGTNVDLYGISNDISEALDPETGQIVSARSVTASLCIKTLLANFAALPRGIHNTNERPWLIEFTDLNDRTQAFKVKEAMPDRRAGIIVCDLEPIGD